MKRSAPHQASTHLFFISTRRRHTRLVSDWSSDVCSSDLGDPDAHIPGLGRLRTAERDGPQAPAQMEADGQLQIGRASCRERVETLVEGVALRIKAIVQSWIATERSQT